MALVRAGSMSRVLCSARAVRAVSGSGWGNPDRSSSTRGSRSYSKQQDTTSSGHLWGKASLAVLASLGSAGLFWYQSQKSVLCAASATKHEDKNNAGKVVKGLPVYRKSDLAKHRTKDQGMWVTFGSGVYDITEFVENHPGGEKILLAAGGSLEPFWQMYAIHKTDDVFEILETLRIGNLHEDDLKAQQKSGSMSDPYRNDPDRHPALTVNSEKPFNAEPPAILLVDNFITPNELFFVRNHLPVPTVDPAKFKLEVSGLGLRRPIRLSIPELKKKFPQHTITAAVQCAGNRRSEMREVKEVKGLNWGSNAISNATWTGVKLVDLLAYAGVSEDNIHHVLFQGSDKDMEDSHYEASIPAETAFDPRKDVLIAYEMNGREIPKDHGFPLRLVVPGSIGARQVKWLSKIIVSKEESTSLWQAKDYKVFGPNIDWSNVDFSKSKAVQEYPIQSSICEPQPGATFEAGDDVTVRGYAWSGGGRGVIRVDVSADAGKTWHEAKLEGADQKYNQNWAWTLWEVSIPAEKAGTTELLCRAIDSSHNVQPEKAENIWNFRGLIHNAWHRVPVNIV